MSAFRGEIPGRNSLPDPRHDRSPNSLAIMRLRTPSRTGDPPPRPPRPRAILRLPLLVPLLLTTGASLPHARQAIAPAAEEGNRVDYVIHAKMEGEADTPKLVFGDLRATWTNGSADAVTDLWFHLYLNAFSNNRSTHFQESRGELRGEPIEDGWGWSRVKEARVWFEGATAADDVIHTFRYRQPDDGRPEDRTVFSLDLPRAVAPGETIAVEIVWESQLPRVRRRTGAKGDFLLVAQWFPKLGVYEGGRGWNCHQFHRSTEFFSDYGTYDVTLDLPEKYAGHVGASGVKTNDVAKGDRVEVRFEAPSNVDRRQADRTGRQAVVHDFVWTGDPSYVPYTDTFRFQKWAENYPEEVAKAKRIFGEDIDVTLRDVDVTVLIHPERKDQVIRHFEATCAALFFYGLWFGEYPYQHVTVVDPAWGARGAGGMEYPTLFTCGTSLLNTEEMHSPEGVTIHECGHQFWYGLVGNNEFEAAFLDEGFNSYTDSEVILRVYGLRAETTRYSGIPIDGVRVGGDPFADEEDSSRAGLVRDVLGLQRIPVPVIPDLRPINSSGFLDLWRDQPRLTFVRELTDPRWGDRAGYLAEPDTDPIETHGWEYADSSSYRANSYSRTAVALRTLSSVIGYDDFLRGMRHYSTTWRYQHPYPADFYSTFQEGAGVDVEWYFRELFQGTGTGDWSVEVTQDRRARQLGYSQGEGGRWQLPLEDASEVVDDSEEPWQISILLRCEGELRIDMPYRLTYEDGTVEDGVWTREEQGQATWKRIDVELPQKLVSVVLDPERGNYLDLDMSNNQWYDAVDEVAPWRWGERVLAQYQRSLHWLGGIGG